MVLLFNVTDGGVGYGTAPTIMISAGCQLQINGIGETAVGIASIGLNGSNTVVKSILRIPDLDILMHLS
jgi:hypothetical protein